jgi:predicted PurR-regulated permease PerM
MPFPKSETPFCRAVLCEPSVRPLRAFRKNRSGEEVSQLAIRLGLLACLIYWSFVIVRPFIPILAWSVVLTVALYPAYRWFSDHLGDRPRLASAIITLAGLAIVVGPATWLGLGLFDGLKHISEQLDSGGLAVPSPPARIEEWPVIGPRLHELWKQASTNLEAVFHEVAPHLKPLASVVLSFATGLGTGTLQFLASVILAGFLFPWGPRLVAASRNMLAHVVPEQSEHFLALAGVTIRTVSQGVIGVAVLQSLLAGIGIKVAGVPHASLLAFAILILAILQLGSALVLIPVVIWLWMTKDFAVAFTMTIYLALVGVSDNVLKPLLMGRGLSTPMLVIFIGVLGGMLAHGIVGLFVGPIVLAVAWELMMAWIRDEVPGASVPDAKSAADIRKTEPETSDRPLLGDHKA